MRRRRRLAASAWRRLRPGDGMRGASPPVAGQPAVASASSLPSAHARGLCRCSLPRRSSSTSTAPIGGSCSRASDPRLPTRGSGRGSWATSPMKPLPASTTGSPRRACDAWTRRTSRPWCPGSRRSWTSLSASSPSAEGLSPCGDDARGAAAGGAAQAPTGSQPAPAGPDAPGLRSGLLRASHRGRRRRGLCRRPAAGASSTASMPTQSGDASW